MCKYLDPMSRILEQEETLDLQVTWEPEPQGLLAGVRDVAAGGDVGHVKDPWLLRETIRRRVTIVSETCELECSDQRGLPQRRCARLPLQFLQQSTWTGQARGG